MERRTFLQAAATAPAALAATLHEDLPKYRIVSSFQAAAHPGMPGPYPGKVAQVHAAARVEDGVRVGEERVRLLIGVHVVDVDLVAGRLQAPEQLGRMDGALEVHRDEAGHQETVQGTRRIRAGDVQHDPRLAGLRSPRLRRSFYRPLQPFA